jgi:hypothetical protein
VAIANVSALWSTALMGRIAHESGPLRTQILTRGGWLSHDQVRPGDETLGYNPATGRSEWTPVLAVHHYEDAEVWRIGNVHWRADVTPNHRWWSDSRASHGGGCRKTGCGHSGAIRGEFVETSALRSHHRIRLAAAADTGRIPRLGTGDCAVIGWLMGDGHVGKARGQRVIEPSVRETRAGKRVWISSGKRAWTDEDLGWDAAIYQAKPESVVWLRTLLVHVPHTERVRQRSTHRPQCGTPCQRRHTNLPSHEFVLRREYATDLLKRARWGEITPEEFVLALSPDQRAAWLAAIIDAEGSRVPGYQPWHKDHVRIAQNEGPLLEAIKLAVYLEGFQPSVVRTTPSGQCRTIGMRSPHAALPGWAAPEVLERQSVWCVTTGLGTWTMRQEGGLPCLTGNSVPAELTRGGMLDA